ncbi:MULTISPECIES: NAD(P)-dependent alcohol dehydrogenase [Agrobacterium]|uniref:NAD(P)-dependent alcohol dehydrogenase n=1 Tax=Agrobacterium rosae TaxID=1972867 RepID=A0AAW9FEW5_9HYPH|nr:MULTISPECIES: NAD(P)-dependent alcohol dehydrogenase [Agrobacterium]MDX8303904.1 NAD(P)-dependent alcohol dehydrogenase [Agrobacterium rosae]POO55360.1 NAD(P)-dependent alcohol dehydrogenase [Agrobacterium rosae]SCX11218.1 D-xylulose reductase [Agrobacterium sp. DSM 25558]
MQSQGISVTGEERALVLEELGKLSLRPFPLNEQVGPHDVRIAIHTVGICGSDVHYYTHGAIGNFVVREPMILGHEASGTVTEVGSGVTNLSVGDRVCMEPGIPDPISRASRIGHYNLDPAVRFWATPPIHGVLRASVVHPAAYTFKLPDNVSFAAGAMVEPLAVGVQAATQAKVKPGDIAVVIGAGPIGLVTVLAALAAGCARVIVSDVDPVKLDMARGLGPVETVNVREQNLAEQVLNSTAGWGADVIFECSGAEAAITHVFEPLRPAGTVVFVGMPTKLVAYDMVAAQIREARVEHVFRYANVFGRCVDMLASGAIDVAPLITRTFDFEDSIKAFDLAASAPAGEVKMQILMPQ